MASWDKCVELSSRLRNDKPGIGEVVEINFTDFIKSFKSRSPRTQKEEIRAVKTLVEKIQRLKRCLLGFFYDPPLSVSDHFEILYDVLQNVKVDELWIQINDFPPDQTAYLARICKNCQVKSLMLRHCNLQSEHLIQFAENIGDAKLESLDVSFNHLAPSALIHLATICEICQVNSLELRRCGLDCDRLKEFVDKADNIKLERLDVSGNHLAPSTLIHLATICEICQVKSLELRGCRLDSEHLKLFANNAKNIKLEKLDVYDNHLAPSALIHLATICEICQVKSLELRGCELDSEHLKQFVNNAKNIKIDYLDISENRRLFHPPKKQPHAMYYLIKICEDCQLKSLNLRWCNLKSEDLMYFVENAQDTKIVEMNVRFYDITWDARFKLQEFLELDKKIVEMDVEWNQDIGKDAKSKLQEFLERNKKRVKSEELYRSAKRPGLGEEASSSSSKVKKQVSAKTYFFTTSASSATTSDEDMEKIIRESLSVPVIKGELIGPEGGSLDVMECRAVYPANAFQEKTPVRHSVRSDYHDAPEGYVVCSPELECSTFGVPFQGSVHITLPLHILPEDGLVEIFKKESHSSPWTQLHYSPVNNDNKTVTFYVTHFCKIKALLKYYVLGWWKTFLCHYLFYKPATSQLYAVTCIDDPTVKMKCVAEYERKRFLEAHPQPKKVSLSNNDEVRFKYKCIEPDTSRLDPDISVVVTRHQVDGYTFKSFKLCPEPHQNIRSVTLRCWMKPPQEPDRESVIVLEWNTQAVARRNVLRDATEPVQEININRCTREFYERHLNDDDIYQFVQNRSKGKVLIINNKFEGNREMERTGSDVDVGNLQMLWTNLGFDVVTEQNLSAEEMLTSCEEFGRATGEVSSVFVIIMSHGGMVDRREFISGEDMGEVPTENIISFFTARNCPHLRSIPKVFMFQACRGNQRDRVDAGPVGEPNRPRIPDRADMLIAYPCQSGYVSYRNPLTGSWLMNAVTNIFMSHAHDTDLLGMLTKVNNEVARKEGQQGDVQASNQETYLRRQLYLFPGWPN